MLGSTLERVALPDDLVAPARGQELARSPRSPDPQHRRVRRRRLGRPPHARALQRRQPPDRDLPGHEDRADLLPRDDHPGRRAVRQRVDGLEVPGSAGPDSEPLLPQLRDARPRRRPRIPPRLRAGRAQSPDGLRTAHHDARPHQRDGPPHRRLVHRRDRPDPDRVDRRAGASSSDRRRSTPECPPTTAPRCTCNRRVVACAQLGAMSTSAPRAMRGTPSRSAVSSTSLARSTCSCSRASPARRFGKLIVRAACGRRRRLHRRLRLERCCERAASSWSTSSSACSSGLITVSVTHPHRRVGDFAAGTYVVAAMPSVPRSRACGRCRAIRRRGRHRPRRMAARRRLGCRRPGAPPQPVGPAARRGPPTVAAAGVGNAGRGRRRPTDGSPVASAGRRTAARRTDRPEPAPADEHRRCRARAGLRPRPSARRSRPASGGTGRRTQREPQWDAQRNVWVFWEAETSRWLQHDPRTGQWGPLR